MLIVVDTNVASESMKPKPDGRVEEWMAVQGAENLYITSISIAEMRYGVNILPEGRRKQALHEVLQRVLGFYAMRVLVFDGHAARHYAEIAANAKLSGRTLPVVDGYIAAMAVAGGYAVASRDVGPFTAAGLEVINPWL